MQLLIVIFTDVLGQLTGPIFMGQGPSWDRYYIPKYR